jgi:hypothetical protein
VIRAVRELAADLAEAAPRFGSAYFAAAARCASATALRSETG